MADSPETTTEVTTTTPAPEPEKTVPYERFAQVNQKAADATKQLGEMQARIQEIEDRDKSEVERASTQLQREQAKREGLEAELQDNQKRLVNLERSQWIRNAAAEANFIDSTDALGRVDLSNIETETEAKRAIKKIAENATHLIRQESPRPEIGRVVQGGQPVQPGQQAPPPDNRDEEFLAELKAASTGGWSSSGAGLLDA